MIQSMRNDIYFHTQCIPMDYYVHTPAGSIVSRITNDTEAIRDLFERVLSIVVTSAIYMAGIFVALFILDAKLATRSEERRVGKECRGRWWLIERVEKADI